MASELLLTLIAVFGSVALLTGLTLSRLLARTSVERRRLAALTHGGDAAGSGLVNDMSLLRHEPSEMLTRVTGLVPSSAATASRLRKRFMRAGYLTSTPLAIYTVAQIGCTVAGAILPLFFWPMAVAWPLMLICAFVMFQVPGMVLQHKIHQRQKVLRNGLPDALDLMIVCLESGSAIDQAIVKVAEELQLPYPALAEEFRLLITETRAGKPRMEAFRNLSERTGLDEIRSLVAMLVQTDRFGTSVAQALRTHAEVLRMKRRQRAEEAAAKIGVKLAFPLVFCLFPAFFIVTVGPAIIQFIRVFFVDIMGN